MKSQTRRLSEWGLVLRSMAVIFLKDIFSEANFAPSGVAGNTTALSRYYIRYKLNLAIVVLFLRVLLFKG